MTYFEVLVIQRLQAAGTKTSSSFSNWGEIERQASFVVLLSTSKMRGFL